MKQREKEAEVQRYKQQGKVQCPPLKSFLCRRATGSTRNNMPYLIVLLYLLWVVVVLARGKVDAAKIHQQVNQGEAQIQWIHARGGYVHPDLQLKPLFESDPESPVGMFASQNIGENETLVIIPQSCLLTTGVDDSESTCDTARNLMKHRELGDQSEFAPYVKYIFGGKQKGRLPAAWSTEGQELLLKIIGKELLPKRVTDISFETECEGEGSEEEEEAYLLVRSRKMVPVLDMFNHRNGRWTNIGSNSVHAGEDITVFASRDIEAGEQLYLSYNECADCTFALTYTLPHMVKDFGFVEQYPRRWLFDIEQYPHVVFELDEEEGTGELTFTWLSEEPDEYPIAFLRGHLRRLRELGSYVATKSAELVSDHERYVAVEYYEALVTALECAIRMTGLVEEDEETECSISVGGETTCTADESRTYDDLEEPDIAYYTEDVCTPEVHSSQYDDLDSTSSRYQTIDYMYSEEHGDTCLALNDHLQACTSFRPHYHEVFVHYPARYVDEVKRVAFIGGGDNMIVHEILKYPSLELAVGLELDHVVVRSSFKNFGTQPHWEDDRLQWWFGDASKSLLMLPQEYYGTFDLVLLDLQTEVAEVLKVTQELNIMDAALLLLKPDGVIARNEDWEYGTANAFTEYAVDLYYIDVPILCKQGITMGSNAVDFLKRTPKDHGIDTVYVKSLEEENDPFRIWYNYVSGSSHAHKLCKESDDERKTVGDGTVDTSGVLMILEAEDAQHLANSESSLQDDIGAALKTVGLTELSVITSPPEMGGVNELVFVLQEGYVVARTWGPHRYCAFDIMLWNSIEKQESTKTELVAAIGSNSTSSYRLIAGGIVGTSMDESATDVGPQVTDVCETPVDDPRDAPAAQTVVDTILEETLSLALDSAFQITVLCGDEALPCHSLNAVENKLMKDGLGQTAVPIWTCPSVATSKGAVTFSTQSMIDCERDTLGRLENLIKTDGRIGVIVIDPSMPQAMGQVIHKIFDNKRSRIYLLTDEIVVLAMALGQAQAWHRAFLDRFRADFATYEPAFRAEVIFNSTTSSVELGVFSSGNEHFYADIADVIGRIEGKTSLVSEVRQIVNGLMNYVADFEPSKTAAYDDYDTGPALRQFASQQPLGEQTMIELSIAPQVEVAPLSRAQIEGAFRMSLQAVLEPYEPRSPVQMITVGEGCVVVGFWWKGSVLATWDGRASMSVYSFSYKEEGDDRPAKFAQKLERSVPGLTVTASDVWPRGIAGVVNFPWDIGSLYETPHWA